MREGLLAVIIGGILAVVAAYVLGGQIADIRTADRTVTVHGAAELPVTADLATWNLGVIASDNDLRQAQAEVNRSAAAIRAFLQKYGIQAEDIGNQNVSVSDNHAHSYNNNSNVPRFTISGGVTVRTTNLEGARQARNALGELVGEGVILTNSWGPNYAFTELNEHKPELVSKATAAARMAAEQFAKDSNTEVGDIRRARQGSVQILGRDGFMSEGEQVNKILRVVTTIDYELN